MRTRLHLTHYRFFLQPFILCVIFISQSAYPQSSFTFDIGPAFHSLPNDHSDYTRFGFGVGQNTNIALDELSLRKWKFKPTIVYVGLNAGFAKEEILSLDKMRELVSKPTKSMSSFTLKEDVIHATGVFELLLTPFSNTENEDPQNKPTIDLGQPAPFFYVNPGDSKGLLMRFEPTFYRIPEDFDSTSAVQAQWNFEWELFLGGYISKKKNLFRAYVGIGSNVLLDHVFFEKPLRFKSRLDVAVSKPLEFWDKLPPASIALTLQYEKGLLPENVVLPDNSLLEKNAADVFLIKISFVKSFSFNTDDEE